MAKLFGAMRGRIFLPIGQSSPVGAICEGHSLDLLDHAETYERRDKHERGLLILSSLSLLAGDRTTGGVYPLLIEMVG